MLPALIIDCIIAAILLRTFITMYLYYFKPAYKVYKTPTSYEECRRVNEEKARNTGESTLGQDTICKYTAHLDLLNSAIPYDIQKRNYENCLKAGGERKRGTAFSYDIDYCLLKFETKNNN